MKQLIFSKYWKKKIPLVGFLLIAAVLSTTNSFMQAHASSSASAKAAPAGAFYTRQYRNLFAENGHSQKDIQSKLDAAWMQLFYGDNNTQRVYYPVGTNMAYIEDIGNQDVRTEGMSYGMMIAVQLNKPQEFNRLWTWAKTYMYQTSGDYKGYFSWHNKTDGTVIDANPASDGDQWFAMDLFLAAGRWGNGTGIYNYQAQAQSILHNMLHHGNVGVSTNMFDLQQKQVDFVPSGTAATYTDPSYHLPAFYRLWALWASEDNRFWADAATTSIKYFKKTTNAQTGLAPDYSNYDGTPVNQGGHGDFRFDAWRVASNVALDYSWFATDPWEVYQSNRLQNFFASQGAYDSTNHMYHYGNQYSLTGTELSQDHSGGLAAMNSVAGLAAMDKQSKNFVDEVWNMPIPSGQWRYYDGMLYMLSLLEDSGNFRIYAPHSVHQR
ncbi:hypothetical protein KDH_03790 [Dictyobacter sp. S3.2.2.5]|uniref:Glycoside hydrolase n=1 Tax=Dictyobacter halimunensis TaxID=3026934 RepID=A0ABQ6FIT5_9CHLR|nr:hypothetical protein KDH_03790 [Dictyobacter sp. S3.2.2.5]